MPRPYSGLPGALCVTKEECPPVPVFSHLFTTYSVLVNRLASFMSTWPKLSFGKKETQLRECPCQIGLWDMFLIDD